VIVYAIVDDSLSRFVLGDVVETFVQRDDAERFITEVRGDDPELAESCESRSASWRRAGRTSPTRVRSGASFERPSLAA
jgi:hypothetical protein